MSEPEVRKYISTTAQNIKTHPIVTTKNRVNSSQIPFGQHFRIEFRHPQKGEQWIECIRLKESFFVLASSLVGIRFGAILFPKTESWNVKFYIDFSFQISMDYPVQNDILLRVGEITAIKFFSESIVHKILDKPLSFSKGNNQEIKNKQKLRIKQKEKNLLLLIEQTRYAIEKHTIVQNYKPLKAIIGDIDLSTSYMLNILIDAIQKDKTLTYSSTDISQFDPDFFVRVNIKKIDDDILKSYKRRFAIERHKYENIIQNKNAKIKRRGLILWLLFFVLTPVLIAVFGINLELRYKLSEVESENIDLERKNTHLKGENAILEKEKNNLAMYSFHVGMPERDVAGWRFDGKNWILWLNAKEKVCVESFFVCSNSTGEIQIGFFDTRDSIVDKVTGDIRNAFQSQKIDANVVLNKGVYYMRIINDKELQWNYASDNEYQKYLGGYLEVTGTSSYGNRTNEESREGHTYYQNFYDIRYHLATNQNEKNDSIPLMKKVNTKPKLCESLSHF